MRTATFIFCEILTVVLILSNGVFAQESVEYEPFSDHPVATKHATVAPQETSTSSSSVSSDQITSTSTSSVETSSSSSVGSTTPASVSSSSQAQSSSTAKSADSQSSLSSEGSTAENTTTEDAIKQKDPAELFKLQASLGELTFEHDKTDENRDNLVLAYEKVLSFVCMPHILTTLQYEGYSAQNQDCLDYLKKIFKIDSSNPVAFCARDGIDSKNCIEAFSRQKVGTYGPIFDPRRLKEDTAGVNRKNVTTQEAIARALSDLSNLQKALRTNPQDEIVREQLEALYHRILVVSCAVVRLDLKPVSAPTTSAIPRPLDREATLEQAIGALGTAPKKPVKKSIFEPEPLSGDSDKKAPPAKQQEAGYGPVLQRTRSITSQCQFFINDALSFERDLPTAICHRDSFVAPTCIQALRARQQQTLERIARQRAERAAQRGTQIPQRPTKGGPGFSTF